MTEISELAQSVKCPPAKCKSYEEDTASFNTYV